MPELETSLYSVTLLNDDETPMEFVVHVLEVFFGMDWDRERQKTLVIDEHGTRSVGVILTSWRRRRLPTSSRLRVNINIPLRCTFEKALRTPEGLSSILTISALGQKQTCAVQNHHAR